MDKLTPKETSKGAEEIVLTQIKQGLYYSSQCHI
jgi:hypothetical protein